MVRLIVSVSLASQKRIFSSLCGVSLNNSRRSLCPCDPSQVWFSSPMRRMCSQGSLRDLEGIEEFLGILVIDRGLVVVGHDIELIDPFPGHEDAVVVTLISLDVQPKLPARIVADLDEFNLLITTENSCGPVRQHSGDDDIAYSLFIIVRRFD